MKTSSKLVLSFLMISIFFGFTSADSDGLNVTYGVAANDPSQIELRLKQDFTFFFQDFSIESQKVKVQGTYRIKNNKIQLIPEDKEIKFHDIWKLSNEGQTVKSRKGLTFYTLQSK